MTSVVLISSILGYLAGSVPFGLVLTMASGLGDIRKIGSGNIGATNVLRTGRKDLALLTLIFDVAKAGFIALFCQDLFDSQAMGLLAGTMAVIGHNFPVWLHFKGGKGVASTLGLMLAMTPVAGIMTCLTWLGMAMFKHYSSLSALTALALAPIYAWVFNSGTAALFYLALTFLSFYRHRGNIQRLWNGTETKIDLKKKAIKKKK